jgi:hypothetical protein
MERRNESHEENSWRIIKRINAMDSKTRDQAEPIAEAIIQHLGNYIRYRLSCWPKADDFADMKRIIKSIIVQHLAKGEANAKEKS